MNTTPPFRKTWTPGRMQFQLEPDVERYLVSHSTGYTEPVARLVDETAALGEPSVMMAAKEQYAFFRFLASHLDCRRILDIGTFTGLSALAFAEGMRTGGRVTTIERDPGWIAKAEAHWKRAGVAERIDVRVGEAADVLADIAAVPDSRFDIVFIDVDKARVGDYVERSLALLAPRGLVIVDNALWHGWVLDPARTDPDTEGMRRFNDRIAHDPRVDVVILPIADGLTMIRYRN